MKRFLLALSALTLLIVPARTQSVVHSTSITWNWTQGTGGSATGFNVYRSVTPNGLPVRLFSITGISTMSYVDLSGTGNILVEGSTYCYTVTAVGQGGESDPSNQFCGQIPFPVSARPGAPTGLTGVVR